VKSLRETSQHLPPTSSNSPATIGKLTTTFNFRVTTAFRIILHPHPCTHHRSLPVCCMVCACFVGHWWTTLLQHDRRNMLHTHQTHRERAAAYLPIAPIRMSNPSAPVVLSFFLVFIVSSSPSHPPTIPVSFLSSAASYSSSPVVLESGVDRLFAAEMAENEPFVCCGRKEMQWRWPILPMDPSYLEDYTHQIWDTHHSDWGSCIHSKLHRQHHSTQRISIRISISILFSRLSHSPTLVPQPYAVQSRLAIAGVCCNSITILD
jgi:hypothetical protein